MSSAMQQVEALEAMLHEHPEGMTKDEIEATLARTHFNVQKTGTLIRLARTKYGRSVIVCGYDRSRRAYLYRHAASLEEGYQFSDKATGRSVGALLRSLLTDARAELLFPGQVDPQTSERRRGQKSAALYVLNPTALESVAETIPS